MERSQFSALELTATSTIRCAFIAAGLTGMAAAAIAQTGAANGFVTKVESATAFEVGDTRVVLNSSTECGTASSPSFSSFRYFLRADPANAREPFSKRYSGVTRVDCGSLRVVVGSPIYFDGPLSGNVVQPTDVIRYLGGVPKSVSGGALEEEDSTLRQTPAGWSGLVWLDGYPLVVTPQTKLFAEPDGTTMDYQYYGAHIRTMPKRPRHAQPSAMRAELLKAGHGVSYKADRAPDGRLTATEMHFWTGNVGPEEKTYLARYRATITPPDFAAGVAGTLQYTGEHPISILPNQRTQDWITGLGNSLIPAYQRDLPENDPAKINFRFVVIAPFVPQQKNYFLETSGALPYVKPFRVPMNEVFYSPRPGKVVRDVLFAPDGTVLVPVTAITKLRSETQIAFLLSTAISSIVQRQGYTIWRFVTGPKIKHINGVVASVGQTFSIFQSEEMLRLAIRRSILAAFNPAPAAFASTTLSNTTASGDPVNNPDPLPDARHSFDYSPDTTFAYTFAILRRYYDGTDFGSLKEDSADFRAIKAAVGKAAP